jgi:hypothetical protein
MFMNYKFQLLFELPLKLKKEINVFSKIELNPN